MIVVFVGRGRVGHGLKKRTRERFPEWRLTSGHHPSRRLIGSADVVVLAVPDPAIAETGRRITPWLKSRARVLHCAGSRTADELDGCRGAGASVGAMHPLASFADPKRPPDLRGATFVISGDPPAVSAARRVARAVEANPLALPVHGPGYHALAAMVAGGTVGFVHTTIPVLEGLGFSRRDAERAAASLVRTVADNIAGIGLPAALTGPVIRGDAGTVAAHRKALRALSPEVARAYDAVAPLVLACAVSAGLDRKTAAAIRQVLGGR
ncbi:MAG: DUF2520 domain-containing protein [Gammaproteobacteria bacterium]|nr:DUF2520 domain-containing protein [Gammaproteobacteria bacterium]